MQLGPGLWNPEYTSGIRNHTWLIIRIRNTSSTAKDGDQVPVIRNPQREIQNARLSWVILHGPGRVRILLTNR